MINIYQVGGSVRDEFLGVKSKDIDYAVEAPSYDVMRNWILSVGGEIFVEKPEFLTIRAKIGNIASDFVMCRKDGTYSDGRRPDNVIPGTIYDDLQRRDFTMNAIAKNEKGEYLDYFSGIRDIQRKIICCVGNPADRFSEDYLRMARAIRFSVTKDMFIDWDIEQYLYDLDYIRAFAENISIERVKEELEKMFRHDTIVALQVLNNYPKFRDTMFQMCAGKLWLKPVLENK